MTITVTVEELEKYQNVCAAWSGRRADFYGRQLVLVTEHSLTTTSAIHERAGTVEKMRKWESENPFPRIVPAV